MNKKSNLKYAGIVFTLALLSSATAINAQPAASNGFSFPDIPLLKEATTASADTENTEVASDTTTNSKVATKRRLPPSYGDWPKSLMFPEKEINYMKTILDEYEATGEIPLELQDIPEIVDLIDEPLVEIVEYPSFHLKSILYHSPNYWSVWINDIKITSRDNNSEDYEIKVVSITKDIVRFKWQPVETLFIKEYTRQLPDLKAIAEDTVLPIVNRTSRSAQAAKLSEEEKAIYFSLRLNESFSTETFYTFDGKPPSLVYTSLATPYTLQSEQTAVTSVPIEGSPAGSPDATPPASSENLDEALDAIDNSSNSRIDQFEKQQSPKDIIDSITPEKALDLISSDKAQEVLESLTPEQAKEALEAITN